MAFRGKVNATAYNSGFTAVDGVAMPLGSIISRTAPAGSRVITCAGSVITIPSECCDNTVFYVTVSATVNSTATGTGIVTLYQNGTAVTGGTASVTIGTVSTEYHSFSFRVPIRVCGCQPTKLTLVTIDNQFIYNNLVVCVEQA